MDYSIELRIQKDDLAKAGVIEELTSWGDEVISFKPKRFYSKDNVHLIETESDSEEDCIVALRVAGDLRGLEWQANKNREMFENNDVMKFLEKISCLSYFCIIIKEDDEKIQGEVKLNHKNSYEIYQIIADTLNWENPRNLIICSQSSN